MNSPAQILQIWIGNSVKKATLPVSKMILLGIAAGIYIGFGAHAFLLSTAAAETAFEAMAAKLIGSALFPVGLMLVVLCGGELFTGNNLLTLGLLDKKISPAQLLKSWVVVYFANFLGSVGHGDGRVVGIGKSDGGLVNAEHAIGIVQCQGDVIGQVSTGDNKCCGCGLTSIALKVKRVG